jgi:hypothetical protein
MKQSRAIARKKPPRADPKSKFTEVLYLAMMEPVGLLLQSSDTKKALQALYRARSAALDPALKVLSFRVSPLPTGDIIIVKKAPDDETEYVP